MQTVRPLGPDTGLKLTTARYYTPSGNSIQAKGIVPDVLVDETPKATCFAALRTREADLQKHLGNDQGPRQERRRETGAAHEARASAWKKKPRSRRTRTARCRSSAPTRTSSWCRP